jgi:choline dehydrogenase-like flavoprotein
MSAPVASGWSGRRVGLAPTGKAPPCHGARGIRSFAATTVNGVATAGAKNISASRTVLNSPGHLLGTARMGLDPDRSVVNEWGRCHDVKNLFIVDGSIWGSLHESALSVRHLEH